MNKPSVTELTKLLDKPGLLYWANKIGLNGVSLKEARNKNTSKGTNLHKQIEEYILYKTPVSNNHLKMNIDNFLKDIEILEIEKTVENNLICGRLDILYKKNNKIYIGDFKTNQKNIYLENKLQLIAYSLFYEVDGYSIINVPSMEIINIDIKNIEPYKEILNSLYKIHINKKLIENE